MHQDEEYDELIRIIGESYIQLGEEAYELYRPITNDLCSRTALEEEVEHTLDWMLGFCGYEKMLDLFKMICRKYIYVYPRMIEFEIQQYREMFDSDDEPE